MNFKYEENKIYLKNDDEKVVAEITFPNEKANIVNINYVFVDESIRGQGIANKIMKEAVKQIKKSGKKVIASCPFAKSWFEKNIEYKELLIKN